jgi:hypothetical protein
MSCTVKKEVAIAATGGYKACDRNLKFYRMWLSVINRFGSKAIAG